MLGLFDPNIRSDSRGDVDALAVAQSAADAFELHNTVGQGIQGVVLAGADIHAGQNRAAALTDQDRTGRDGLAAVGLDAEAFGVRIATVAG